MHRSGMDWSVPGFESKTSNSKPRVAKGLDPITWSNRDLHLDPSCWIRVRPATTLVKSPRNLDCQLRLISNRFIPPHLDRERSNIENSENSTLFLVSCYEYILSAIVLSIGPPFRQPMSNNRKSDSILHQCMEPF